MSRNLRQEGLDFLATAPVRVVSHATLAAGRARVFDAVAADPAGWTWFPGFSDDGRYVTPPPFGVGAVREVRMAGATFLDTVLVWDAPERWAFRVDVAQRLPVHAVLEDYTFTDATVAGGPPGTLVSWTLALDPHRLFRPTATLARVFVPRLFARAMRNLDRVLAAGRDGYGVTDTA